MPRNDQTLKLKDGRTLGYATYGAHQGREILYFHGGLSSRLDIEFADTQLRNLNVKLIAPDRPGIGLSSRQPGRTLRNWADDVRQLIEHLCLEKPAVLGWSLGAPYAFACSALLQKSIGRVGTVGGIGPMDSKEAIDSLGLLEDRILLGWPEPILHALRPVGLIFKYLPPHYVKQTLLRAVKAGPDFEICSALSVEEATSFGYEALRQGFEGSLDDYLAIRKPWGYRIEDIESKVYLWQGKEDHLCPASAAEKLVSRFKNGQITFVENSGHFLLHTHLAEVVSVLLEDSAD